MEMVISTREPSRRDCDCAGDFRARVWRHVIVSARALARDASYECSRARTDGIDAVASVDRRVYEEFRSAQDVPDHGTAVHDVDVRGEAGDGGAEGNAG